VLVALGGQVGDRHGRAGGVVGVHPAVPGLLPQPPNQHDRHVGGLEVGEAFVVVGHVGHDEASDLELLPQLLVVGAREPGSLP
jgi:hypothetical protein